MTTKPRSRRAPLLAATVALTASVTAGCFAPSLPDPSPSAEATTAAPWIAPSPGEVMDENYVDPAAPARPAPPTPSPDPAALPEDEVIETHPDPGAYGLTSADELDASRVAAEFITTVWTWDGSDTGDRAGLQRALTLATPALQDRLAAYINDPLFTPQEWATIAGRPDVGSLIEILIVWPHDEGPTNPNTYTARVVFNTFIPDPIGVPMPRDEDARHATLTLTRQPDSTWLVDDLPYLDTEQVIETPSTL